jgi:DNA-binding NarL/FixJ family response regulator
MVAELIPGTERISVHVAASDPLSRAGISSQLRGSAVDLVEIEAVGQDVVALVIADQMDAEISRLIRSLRMRGARRVIVVATRLDDAGLLAAVEAGASGLIRRSQATPQNLIGAIRTAANGEG